MTSSIYRRESMAQLYEKLKAQDDDDDMAWLAQYSPDDKSDEPLVAAVRSTPGLSTISSASPVSCSSGSSLSDPVFDESDDDHFGSDSDSDVDHELVSFDSHYGEFDPSCSALIFQSNDSEAEVEATFPCLPPVQEIAPQREYTPLIEPISPPAPVLPPLSIASHRARAPRQPSVRHSSSDSSDDTYSESEGNGTEDEYIPSPSLSSGKRRRAMRSVPSATASSSQRRRAESSSRKRPRNFPHPRNIQAVPGAVLASPRAKKDPWACPHCKWVQRNHRTPDLKRHIRTHTRLQRPAQWVCCGIPLQDAEYCNVPADAQPYELDGEMMIGGCRKEFSRRDALKRHLDNDNITCIGNFAVFASIPEVEV